MACGLTAGGRWSVGQSAASALSHTPVGKMFGQGQLLPSFGHVHGSFPPPPSHTPGEKLFGQGQLLPSFGYVHGTTPLAPSSTQASSSSINLAIKGK